MAAREAEHEDNDHDKRPDKERGPRATGRTQNAGASREGRGEKRGGAVWSGAHSAGHPHGTESGVTTTTTNDPTKSGGQEPRAARKMRAPVAKGAGKRGAVPCGPALTAPATHTAPRAG